MTWRGALRTLVQSGEYRTQGALVSALAMRGYSINQGTVSRELSNLGVRKVGGFYATTGPRRIPAPVHSVQFTGMGTLAVVKTDPAHASVLGQFIDESHPAGVIGTVSGDDTVFVALEDGADPDGLTTILGLS